MKDSRLLYQFPPYLRRQGPQRSSVIYIKLSKGCEEISNAFHKHLELNHPDHTQDLSVFKMKVEKTYRKPLDRQIYEGTLIAENERRDHLLNSKMQFHEPSVPRVTVSRQLGSWQLIVLSTYIFKNLALITPLGPARDPELLLVTNFNFSPHYSFDKAGVQRKASALKYL